MTSGIGSFPTTDWGLLGNLRAQSAEARRASLDILIRRYWKPVYLFLRGSGRDEEQSKDLTQAFFLDWLERDAFQWADPAKGRFRTFMLTCLKRFASNVHRAEYAAKRRPTGGVASLDEMMSSEVVHFEPADHQTPESLFNRAWAVAVLSRVLERLNQQFHEKGQEAHADILRSRLVDPILNGVAPVSTEDLAAKYEISTKQVFNLLETAKRAYRQMIRDEVSLYAVGGSEISDELNDLFRILGDKA